MDTNISTREFNSVHDKYSENLSKLILKFEQLKSNDEPLVILTHYKGIPIKKELKVVHVTDETIIVSSQALLNNTVNSNNSAYIMRNNLIEDEYITTMKVIDPSDNNSFLLLSNFNKLENGSISDRKETRIQPMKNDSKIDAINTQTQERVYGEVFDISRSGISLLVRKSNLTTVKQFQDYHINLKELLGINNATIQAKLMSISAYNIKNDIYHFQLHLSVLETNTVSRYEEYPNQNY